MTKSPKQDIADAVKDATTLLVRQAEDAIKVIATATAEALKVSTVKSSDDHDFLLKFSSEVKTKLDTINDNIKELKDGTSNRINALETTSENNSKDILVMKTQIKVWCVALGLGWAVLEVVLRYLKVL